MPPGARSAAVYFRALQSRGERTDRVVAASAPIAHGVEIHRGAVDPQGVMRTRATDSIELPPDRH